MIPDVEPAVRRRIQRLAVFVTGPLASWVGVGFWLAVVAVAIPFAVKLGSVETSKLTEFLPSGAQSTRALELDQRFPSGRALDAEVVYFRRTGLTAADVTHAHADRARLVAAARRRHRAPRRRWCWPRTARWPSSPCPSPGESSPSSTP